MYLKAFTIQSVYSSLKPVLLWSVYCGLPQYLVYGVFSTSLPCVLFGEESREYILFNLTVNQTELSSKNFNITRIQIDMSVVYTTKVLAENIKMKNIRETLFVKLYFFLEKIGKYLCSSVKKCNENLFTKERDIRKI